MEVHFTTGRLPQDNKKLYFMCRPSVRYSTVRVLSLFYFVTKAPPRPHTPRIHSSGTLSIDGTSATIASNGPFAKAIKLFRYGIRVISA